MSKDSDSVRKSIGETTSVSITQDVQLIQSSNKCFSQTPTPTQIQTPVIPAQVSSIDEEKKRKRMERLEQWKRKKAEEKKLEEQKKGSSNIDEKLTPVTDTNVKRNPLKTLTSK